MAMEFSKIRGSAMKLPMGQINLRVPIDVYNGLQAYAQNNFRSLKSQCELILCMWAAENLEGFGESKKDEPIEDEIVR